MIQCTRCSKYRHVTRIRYDKLIIKFGGEKALRENYICMDCRKVDTETNGPTKRPKNDEEQKALKVKVKEVMEREREPFKWFTKQAQAHGEKKEGE